MNPYKILNLKPGATEKEITKAYRSLALLHHPDKQKQKDTNNSNNANDDEMFQKCKDAYQMLMDPQKRAEVDLKLAGEEERKARMAAMDEHRKQLQKDLIERERAATQPKTTTAQSKNPERTAAFQFKEPVRPQYALLLKVKAGGPLPLTPETLSAALQVPPNDEAIQIDLQSNTVLVQFPNAQEAADVLARLPFDAVKSGDWYLGYPPADLFTTTEREVTKKPADGPETKKVKLTREFESDVLKRLREAKNKSFPVLEMALVGRGALMADEFDISISLASDFIDLIEAAENLTEVDTLPEDTKTKGGKENFWVKGIEKVRGQLSIRDFFKGPKRKLVRDDEDSDAEAEDKEAKSNTNANANANAKAKALASLFKPPPPKPTPIASTATNTASKVKPVPQFKWIPGSKFVVDAFNYGLIAGAEAYFLTHFHSDHYQGLNGRFWQAAPASLKLFCSSVTANLVCKELRVPAERIIRLEIGKLYDLGIGDWSVGVLDANHCPGSVMFVFWQRGQNVWHLHTGDFRFHPGLLEGAKLVDCRDGAEYAVSSILFDHVLLDTTYARPDYAFPSQDEVIASCIAGCQKLFMKYKPLVAVGSYLIGKERIVLALAEFFDLPIYADERKRGILAALEWPVLQQRLTADPKATPLHIVSMAVLSKQKLNDYRGQFGSRFSHALGIRPTGWSFSDAKPTPLSEPPKLESQVTLWPLPYSEHSSYAELGAFLRSVTCRRVVPTVDNWKAIGHDLARCNYNTDLLLLRLSNHNKRQ